MNSRIRLFIRALFLAGLMGLSAGVLRADGCLPKPADRLVYDLADFFAPQDEQRLEQRLRHYYYDSAIQMVLVVTDSLCGRSVAMYANEIGQTWGVGTKGADNGIVVVMVPKRPGRSGRIFIAPGRGIQGVLPDAVVKRIVDRVLIPAFRKGAYVEGLEAAFDVMVRAIGGQPPFPRRKASWAPFLVVLGAFSFFILMGVFRAWAAVGAAEAHGKPGEKTDARQAAMVLLAFSLILALAWGLVVGWWGGGGYLGLDVLLSWWGYRLGRRRPERYAADAVTGGRGGGMPWIIGGGRRGGWGGGFGGGGIGFGGGGFNGGGAGGSW